VNPTDTEHVHFGDFGHDTDEVKSGNPIAQIHKVYPVRR